jgi:hypothetical protein
VHPLRVENGAVFRQFKSARLEPIGLRPRPEAGAINKFLELHLTFISLTLPTCNAQDSGPPRLLWESDPDIRPGTTPRAGRAWFMYTTAEAG